MKQRTFGTTHGEWRFPGDHNPHGGDYYLDGHYYNASEFDLDHMIRLAVAGVVRETTPIDPELAMDIGL